MGIFRESVVWLFAEAEGDLTIYRQEDELAEAMWVPAEEIVLDIEEISLTREMMQVFQKRAL